uniref:Uncharacterized protein n=1 Tax=Siphoviridae sp. ctSMg55 TaxID=2825509 RepID=A0A8S5V4W5_9CAUD|nr:MAG TPA: hypothetical protein [Siphoviridae sp. ctSMg55]
MVDNLREVCYDSSKIEFVRAQLRKIILELSAEEQEELLAMIKEDKCVHNKK